MDSYKGCILIASPRLRDPNFFRSAVLIVKHDEHGSMGVVLNRPLELTVRAAWKQVSQEPCRVDGPLLQGGPVEGPLMALHTDLEASDLEILEGLHFSTAKDAIEHLVASGIQRLKLFVGYAGWTAGQLESELKEGAWMVLPATLERVFQAGDQGDVWEALVRDFNRSNVAQWLDPRLIPEDPSVN